MKVGKKLDCLATISLAVRMFSLMINERIYTIFTLPNPTVTRSSFVMLSFSMLFYTNDERRVLNSLTIV